MHLGFSYTGLLFLVMLTVPNLFWTGNRPKDYEKYAQQENKILRLLEKTGQVLVTCLLLIFRDFNMQGVSVRLLWLVAALSLMIIYEIVWVRYFVSEKTMQDFYRSLLGIPVPGAVLPVIACGLLAVYGRNPLLLAATLLFGIGHIGIHINHRKETKA